MNDNSRLFRTIESIFSQLTPSEKRIGSWLLSHREHIPYETADSIALATGTSGITVGRCLRKLGYRNLDDVKNGLKDHTPAPYKHWGVIDRLDSWAQQQTQPDRASLSLQMELDAIRYVYQLAQEETFARVSRRIAQADAVMVLALRTDILVLLKVGTVQNGFTARAFDPQALGHGRSAIGCSHSLGRLGRKQFFKPTHGKTPITTAKSPPACRPGGGGIVEPNHPF